MCGITGYVIRRGAPPPAPVLSRMTRLLAHRGPDDEGLYRNGAVGLGHRRLAVIDPAGSAQPFHLPEHRVTLTYNGEVYNFRDIRVDLAARGHVFKTRGDTEVVARAYAEWGASCLDKFEGQFAFAAWDDKREELFLARDRFGIRPLYYIDHADFYAFASEIKSLFEFPGVEKSINHNALPAYFALRYVPTPDTLFAGIYKLPAGHWCRVSHGGVRMQRYWDLLDESEDEDGDEDRLCAELKECMDASVRARLISDAPVGAFVSGGVDSSLVVAAMASASNTQVRTWSIGFSEGGAYDECPAAERVAAYVGAQHTSVELTYDEFRRSLSDVVRLYDEPVTEPTTVAMHVLARAARDEVKVILLGEGGDEMFAGYPKFAADPWASGWNRAPRWMRTVMEKTALRALPAHEHRLRTAFTAFSQPSENMRWAAWFGNAPERGLQRLVHPDVLKAMRTRLTTLYEKDGARRAAASDLQRMQYCDVLTWLPENMLMKADRALLGAGLEGRMPFLDTRVAEWAWCLPRRYKVRGWTTKYLPRRVAAETFPWMTMRGRKLGFLVPVAHWLRNKMAEHATAVLMEGPCASTQWYPLDAMGDILHEHRTGRADHHRLLWTWIALALWMDAHEVRV